MAPTDEHLAQDGFEVRVEWGPHGLRRLAPVATTLVVVDVLSFTTCVSVAVERGAEVLPYRMHDDGAVEYAATRGAVVAGRRGDPDADYSLSPSSLVTIPHGTRVVLPSPNGSALSFAAREHGAEIVVAGCLRNASAVADLAVSTGGVVGIVPAGERWHGATGPMRVAVEDLLGAGAVVAALPPGFTRSPEAAAAAAVFEDAAAVLTDRLRASPSGRELIDSGFALDVELASEYDATDTVPRLVSSSFVSGSRPDGAGGR